ncbi:30S ribosome-binding factor RbfA [Janibacter sp. DB-40]|uniref:30S ribosome-binding factor RbfA n=1 Tax=Janibacter sp. DB-40 TaxID=3028808 RepID=UPI0024056E37|nr:30S ribosome-binding factor RbfA [Janibacter sp. DB-40]
MADPARARKIADRIKELIAANLEQVVKDPDLGFVTITDVRVTGDLQHASAFYTVFGDEAQRERTAELLEANRGRLRSFVGQRLGIRLTPTLELIPDALPENASHIDELLRSAKERDEDLARSRSAARPAGDPDPYRTKGDDEQSPAAPE